MRTTRSRKIILPDIYISSVASETYFPFDMYTLLTLVQTENIHLQPGKNINEHKYKAS